MVTKPTVGRIVWARRKGNKSGQPEAAQVLFVHGDRLVNVLGHDYVGNPFTLMDVSLVQEGDPQKDQTRETWVEWMPYQMEQAKKQAQATPPPPAETPQGPPVSPTAPAAVVPPPVVAKPPASAPAAKK